MREEVAHGDASPRRGRLREELREGVGERAVSSTRSITTVERSGGSVARVYSPVHDPLPRATSHRPPPRRRRPTRPCRRAAPAPLVREARGRLGRGAADRQRPPWGDGVRVPDPGAAGPQRGHALVRRADDLEQPRREDLAPEGARGRLRGPLRRGRRAHEEDAGAVQPVLPAARRPSPGLRRARHGRGLPPRARPGSRGRHHDLPRRGAVHTREVFASFPDQVSSSA